MRLVSFSVINFRSITKAHKLPITDSTILVGKNNEGKSNILHALTIAMRLIKIHAGSLGRRSMSRSITRMRDVYDWGKDFPIQLQEKKPSGKSVFILEFELALDEIADFKEEINSGLNGILPIEVAIGVEGIPEFKVIKKGPGGNVLSKKAPQVASFVGRRIDLTYIPAVRTSTSAVRVVEDMLEEELAVLEQDQQYQSALRQIAEIQAPVLKRISEKITVPLRQFIPQIKDVVVSISEEKRYRALRGTCEITIDDGIPTSIERKGDGVKNLAAISLLRGSKVKGRASILALEEPESHLHPGAIHRLRNAIEELTRDYQVVITTHCPLFVDRNNVGGNIIISTNKGTPAKKISEVRDVLGVMASDNLLHARLVLVVEGQDDKIALESIFKVNSETLKRALREGVLYVDPSIGAANLSYKIGLYQAAVCLTHVFYDNDEEGRKAIKIAEDAGVLKMVDYNLTICNGMIDSEFEDCLDPEIYREMLQDEFGVNISSSPFKGSKKWSDRLREVFLSQGKSWTDVVEKKVKMRVAKCAEARPDKAMSQHKRSSVDSLIKELERKLTGISY